MSGLVFLRPLWLLALPLIALLGLWLWRRPAALGAWTTAIDPALLAAMARIGRVPEARQGRVALVPLVAAGWVALALAGPAVDRRDAPSFRNLDGVVLVMDLSPSVTGGDALGSLRTAARVVLARLGARPAGLVVFAGDAYVAAPLTSDTRQLGLTVALLDDSIVPDPGSRPGRGLVLAGQLLDEARIVAGDVVLFSDGGRLDATADAAARALAAGGHRLWVLAPGGADLGGDVGVSGAVPVAGEGLAAPAGADTGLSGPVGADPGLAALAQAGGGEAFAADQAGPLVDAITRGKARRLAETDIALVSLRDLGPWLLLPALALLALLFRRPA